MPNTPGTTSIDIQEVHDRNRAARHIIAGFASTTPTLAEMWVTVTSALTDVLTLTKEIARLRLDRADLIAAARATIAAQLDDEDDPLFYLRDALAERGQLPTDRERE